MTSQNIPAAAARPNFDHLKQETAGLGPSADAIEQTLDGALPDNPLQPALSVLRNLVRQFMSRRDEHGLTVKPDIGLAMSGVRQTIEVHPELANPELVKSLTDTALHSGELFVAVDGQKYAVGDHGVPDGRYGAVRAIGTILDKRPDLADRALAENLTRIADNEPDSSVRSQAQTVLGKITDRRPDLIDDAMVKSVSRTAASPVSDHGDKGPLPVERGDDLPFSERGPAYLGPRSLMGWQNDQTDNTARNTAQQTLQTIREKRPDLFKEPNPTEIKKVQPDFGVSSPRKSPSFRASP
jgi:hypothetical protein